MRASAKAKSAAVTSRVRRPAWLQREAGIGMEQDVRADPEAVGPVCRPAAAGLGTASARPAMRLIGPLEVVVFEQRVVDVAGDDVLVGAVGDRRVECLGRLGEGGVEHLLVPVGVGIGIVGAAGKRQATGKRRKD